MTTVIGIAGWDSNMSEYYVLLCADSRGTSNGKINSDNYRKIFTNENSNYVVGIAGRSLSDYFSEQIEPEFHDFFNNPTPKSVESIECMLKVTNDKLERTDGMGNQYFVSVVSSIPRLLTLRKQGLVNAGAYAVIGSGESFIHSLKKLESYVEDGYVSLAKKDAIAIALEAIEEAASKDTYTGGHMNVAIVTNSKVSYKPKYAIIKTSSKADIPVFYDAVNMSSLGVPPSQQDDD